MYSVAIAKIRDYKQSLSLSAEEQWSKKNTSEHGVVYAWKATFSCLTSSKQKDTESIEINKRKLLLQ